MILVWCGTVILCCAVSTKFCDEEEVLSTVDVWLHLLNEVLECEDYYATCLITIVGYNVDKDIK